jgi:phage baseplate assembly protein W
LAVSKLKGIGFYNNDFFIVKTGYDNLKEKIKRILMTVPGERVNNPEFGSRLKTFLFSFDTTLRDRFSQAITEDLQRWEPTISVNDVSVDSIDNHIAKITINFTVKATGDNIDYSLDLM